MAGLDRSGAIFLVLYVIATPYIFLFDKINPAVCQEPQVHTHTASEINPPEEPLRFTQTEKKIQNGCAATAAVDMVLGGRWMRRLDRRGRESDWCVSGLK